MSWPIANAALPAHIAAPLAGPLPVVAVVGIDETCRGKPAWPVTPTPALRANVQRLP